MSVDFSPTIRQAAQLFALAQHLTRHPHLRTVNISEDALQLQYSDHPAADLLAWADSLAESRASVQATNGLAFVRLGNELPPCVASVWTTVPGLAAVLGLDDNARWTPLDLDVLRVFATTSAREVA
ncbi:hypothetical protein [Umezawaea sp. NPDC059074]|uniref:hypothetical protein n=1 Tax=Umezawaea sp. NPDC059074 TaxID=3346716 RepID=UPI0036994491